MNERRRVRATTLLAVVLAAAMLLVSACAPMIPTSGPVGTSQPESEDDTQYLSQPASPQPGASPEDIIRDFIKAGVGAEDDFAVAREFLTDEASQQWRPTERTLVYTSDPAIFSEGDDTYSVQVGVDSSVDSNGIMTPRTSSPDSVEFTLTREGGGDGEDGSDGEDGEEGEWRIAEAPQGIMLSSTAFSQTFRAHTLYFYDRQHDYAVPDRRWFMERGRDVAAETMRALLEGPAPYLQSAVDSAFPDGAVMTSGPVEGEDGATTIELDSERIAGTTAEERSLMRHQARLSLEGLPEVDDVDLRAGEWTFDGSSSLEALGITHRPEVQSLQVGVHDGRLKLLEGLQTLSIAGLPDISHLEPQAPAMPEAADDVYAFLDGDRETLYHVRPDRSAVSVAEGEALTRPSMDNDGWTWTVSNSDSGATIHAVPYDESLEASPVKVSADWLDGREITSLRIAQDGARAAMVVDDGGERTLYVAGVVRDSEGIPRGVATPMALPTTVDVEQVRWDANDALVVWEPGGVEDEAVQIQRVTLDMTTEDVGDVLLAVRNVSTGEGPDLELMAEAAESSVVTLPGDAWNLDNQDVALHDYAYAG